MYNEGLSLDQSPPLTATFLFFLTAPLLLSLSAPLLLVYDISLLERWMPQTIGLAHFFNLGFLSMVMIGALTQMLPVLAGVRIYQVLIISKIVYGLLLMGAILFPIGMIYSHPIIILIGASSAILAFIIFFSSALLALKKGIKSDTLSSFKFSILAAFVTLLWGLRLFLSWANLMEFSMYREMMIELHIAWAIFGMVFTLMMGVSFKVIPMFYVTPPHSPQFTRYSFKFIFLLLFIWSFIFEMIHLKNILWLEKLTPYIKIGLSLIVIIFSTKSLSLLAKRKRPITDTTILYWKLALGLFTLGAICYSLTYFVSFTFDLSIFSAACFFMGLLSVITGMLFKIVPFLIWLHLTEKGIANIPTMRELLPDRLARKQFYLHLGLLFSTIFGIFFKDFINLKFLFSFFLFSSQVASFYLLLIPLLKYRQLTFR